MLKRMFLFVGMGIGISITLSLIAHFLGLDRATSPLGMFGLCLVYGMGGGFINLLFSKWIAKFSYGVKPIDASVNDPRLLWIRQTVERQARQANLSGIPEVGYYVSPEPNAFATGASAGMGLVAVSTGLLDEMDDAEVEAVLAHEISHIANGDMVTMVLLQGVVNACVMFASRLIARSLTGGKGRRTTSEVLLTSLISSVLGIFGMLLLAWFSRQREYRADAGGGQLASNKKMAAALARLQRMQSNDYQDTLPSSVAALKISGKKGGFMALFSTHPPLEDRIARLQGRSS